MKAKKLPVWQQIVGGIALAIIVIGLFETLSGKDKKESEAKQEIVTKPERRSFEELRALKAIPNDTTLACTTKDYLSQLRRAYREDDSNALNHLLKTSCVLLPKGQEITMLDQGYEVSHIRVYTDAGAVELYVSKDQLADIYN